MKGIIAVFLSLITTGHLGAQDLYFSSSIDTNRILIGEPIELSLEAEVAAGTEFFWPSLPDTLKGIELLQAQALDTQSVGDRWQLRQKLIVSAFDSGYFAIPPLLFTAGKQELRSHALAIAADFPELNPEEDYRDIRGPMAAPFNWWVLVLLGLIILALAAGIFLLLRYLRKRQAQQTLSPHDRLSPYELAQLQLQELKDASLWQKGELKRYYSELTDVLRIYLQREMKVNAMESTPEEVAAKVQQLPVAEALKTRVSELMKLSALVKYARQSPAPEWHERGWEVVKDFVEQTHRAKQAAEEKEKELAAAAAPNSTKN